jgi:hypothetical protein
MIYYVAGSRTLSDWKPRTAYYGFIERCEPVRKFPILKAFQGLETREQLVNILICISPLLLRTVTRTVARWGSSARFQNHESPGAAEMNVSRNGVSILVRLAYCEIPRSKKWTRSRTLRDFQIAVPERSAEHIWY